MTHEIPASAMQPPCDQLIAEAAKIAVDLPLRDLQANCELAMSVIRVAVQEVRQA